MERAFVVLASDEPDADIAALAAQIGRIYMLQGDMERASEHVELALGIAEALDLPEVLSQALNTRGGILRQLGRPREGGVLLEHALAVALEHDLHEAALRAYWNLMVLAESRDRWADVGRFIDSGLDLSRRAGIRHYESEFLAASVGPLLELGRWDDAAARAQEIEQEPVEGESVWDLNIHANMAQICAWRGDLVDARRYLARLAPMKGSDALELRLGYAAVSALVLHAEGDDTGALHVAEPALEQGAPLGGAMNANVRVALVQALEAAFALADGEAMERFLGVLEQVQPGRSTPSLRAHGARGVARLAILRGEATGVDAGFEAAAEIFREVPSPYWLGVTLAEHGEWLVTQGRPDEAAPLLAEAREVFDRLGARPWLERLERTAASEVHA